jgi:hypothetical protein
MLSEKQVPTPTNIIALIVPPLGLAVLLRALLGFRKR